MKENIAMSHQKTIREEELKNRVAAQFFGKYDCTRIVGNIDFCVLPKRRDPRQMMFIPHAPILWAEAKNHPTDVYRMLAQLILTIKGEQKSDMEPPRFIGCFDNEKIAFVEYHYILPVFNLNDFNWTQTPARCAWQKQEVLKGIDLLFGTLDGGWGFHCWRRTVGHNMHRTVHYSSLQANAMVHDGSIVANPVFDRGESAMFNATISESDINHILAYNIPAVSSATGKMPVIKDKDESFNLNLNSLQFKSNQWGRNHLHYEQRWLHSDVKNMTFQCVYKLFEDIVTKGALK